MKGRPRCPDRLDREEQQELGEGLNDLGDILFRSMDDPGPPSDEQFQLLSCWDRSCRGPAGSAWKAAMSAACASVILGTDGESFCQRRATLTRRKSPRSWRDIRATYPSRSAASYSTTGRRRAGTRARVDSELGRLTYPDLLPIAGRSADWIATAVIYIHRGASVRVTTLPERGALGKAAQGASV
jgi:hypothetical protein